MIQKIYLLYKNEKNATKKSIKIWEVKEINQCWKVENINIGYYSSCFWVLYLFFKTTYSAQRTDGANNNTFFTLQKMQYIKKWKIIFTQISS